MSVAKRGPIVRALGNEFEPYVWASTVNQIAAKHNLSPAHVLRFDANLPPFPRALPLSPQTALASRAEYPEGTYLELREAIGEYVGCSAENIVIDAGADGCISLIAKTFLEPDYRVVTETPTYPLYSIASRIEGACVTAVPRDIEALMEAGRAASVLWLCNPGNPSGHLWTSADIEACADELPETLVVVDEAYYEYAQESVAEHAVTRQNLICIRTFSKAFGLAGLRVGYLVASREFARELTRRRAPAPVATVATKVALETLKRGRVEHDVALTIQERERMRRAFEMAGYDAPSVHANFVIVKTRDATKIASQLERLGLVTRAYADALRITVRTPSDDDLVLRALDLKTAPSSQRSATVFGEELRVSIVVDGCGNVRVWTGDSGRDANIEAAAADANVDGEIVTAAGATDEAILESLEVAVLSAIKGSMQKPNDARLVLLLEQLRSAGDLKRRA